MMLKFFSIIIFLIITLNANANNNDKIIENLKNTNSIDFNFEQNSNGKKEKGNCTIEYPKKIFCQYLKSNNKILVSDGKSLVIKTKTSYYRYPLNKTPLNLILDKNFLIQKIKNSNERIIENKFINFTFIEDDYEINVFFDNVNFNLIGWQTLDIYQNLSITYLTSVLKNQDLAKGLFIIPKQN